MHYDCNRSPVLGLSQSFGAFKNPTQNYGGNFVKENQAQNISKCWNIKCTHTGYRKEFNFLIMEGNIFEFMEKYSSLIVPNIPNNIDESFDKATECKMQFLSYNSNLKLDHKIWQHDVHGQNKCP